MGFLGQHLGPINSSFWGYFRRGRQEEVAGKRDKETWRTQERSRVQDQRVPNHSFIFFSLLYFCNFYGMFLWLR